MGNPQQSSRFICLQCLKENKLGAGIQRTRRREKNHIKDLTCLNPGCNGTVTKNVEVRFFDNFDAVMLKAEELRVKYYGEDFPEDENGFSDCWEETKIEEALI